MVLTTHAIAGAAVASLNPSRPVSGFFAGFVFHFILDAIPHWEYRIRSGFVDPKIGSRFSIDRDFLVDILRIGSDFTLGVVLSFTLFYSAEFALAVLAGILGGITPDALQFVYGRIKKGPIIYLQKFHEWIHSPYLKLRSRPLLGIILQIAIISAVVFAVY